MITQEYRPRTFDEVVGQELPKKLLKKIVANPENSPRTLILRGPWGCGKTTLARVFARALNCEAKTNVPCGKCKSCLQNIDEAPWYSEYDSGVMGNVEKIRELRDTFFYSVTNGYSVKVFDEAHLMSKAAQSALLKIFEEAPSKVFFVLCTTDGDSLLKTILSRSFEMPVETVRSELMTESLTEVAGREGVEIPQDIIDVICKRSRGHMRDAHMLLDKYLMLGDTDFRETVKSSHKAFYKFFESIGKKDKNLCFRAIDKIMTFPLAELEYDYQEVVYDISRAMVGRESTEDALSVVQILKADTVKIVKSAIADWMVSSFGSDMELQTALLCYYQMVTPMINQGASAQTGAETNYRGVRPVR